MGIEIILGAVITLIVQLMKKINSKIGSNMTLVVVFVLLFVVAAIYTLLQEAGIFSVEFFKTLGIITGTQFTFWGLFVKNIWPKVKVEETPEIK
jgi:hypothetical protein